MTKEVYIIQAHRVYVPDDTELERDRDGYVTGFRLSDGRLVTPRGDLEVWDENEISPLEFNQMGIHIEKIDNSDGVATVLADIIRQ